MSMASELAIETLIYGNQWRWLYEDAGGHWQLTAASQGWRDDLDGITVDVRYEDGRDARSFVLGGFLEAPTGATLETALPAGPRGIGTLRTARP